MSGITSIMGKIIISSCLLSVQPALCRHTPIERTDSLPVAVVEHIDGDGSPYGKETSVVAPHRVVAQSLIRLYQATIRDARGTVCPMHPSCSEYSLGAFAEHNPGRALLMTCDRLLRCGGDPEQYPKFPVDGRFKWYDGDLPDIECAGQRAPDRYDPYAVRISSEEDEHRDTRRAPPRADTVGGQGLVIHEFARWLEARGDYDRAITEYLRLEFLHPQSPMIMDSRIAICRCRYLLGSYPQAVDCGNSLLQADLPPQMQVRILFIVAAARFRSGDYPGALRVFGQIESDGSTEGDETAEKALLLRGLTCAHMLEWRNAEEIFLNVPGDSRYQTEAKSCAYLCRQGYSVKRKNPALAGLLAVIPGLGYLYDGYPRTALSALIINGAFIWGAAEAYDEGRNGLGTMLGIIGLGWYAGNIYGSVTSAERSNHKLDADLLLKFDVGFGF